MTAWQLVLMQVLTFAGLLAALVALFRRQLNSALQRLQVLQEEALVKEAQLKEELRRAQEERAAEVDKGKEEAKTLIEAAKRDAETLRANAELQVKQAGEKMLAHGQEELDKRRANARAEIEAEALHLSLEVVKRAFNEQDHQTFQHHLLEGLIQDIGGLSKDRFALDAKRAQVSSSVALTAEERQRLRRVLSEKVDGDVALEERLDPDLITGLTVQVGSLVIDGSLKSKLGKILAGLRSQ